MLAHLAPTLNLTLIAAHLDHEWRTQSFKDVQFCKELCENLGIQLITQKLSDLGLNLKFNGSQEDIGRKVTSGGLIAISNWHVLSEQGEELEADDTTAPGADRDPAAAKKPPTDCLVSFT